MNKLEKLRKNKGLTMKQVAEALNYKYKSAINNIEKGRAVPNPSRIKRMSEIYDCSIADIVNALIEIESTQNKYKLYEIIKNKKPKIHKRNTLLYKHKIYMYIKKVLY